MKIKLSVIGIAFTLLGIVSGFEPKKPSIPILRPEFCYASLAPPGSNPGELRILVICPKP